VNHKYLDVVLKTTLPVSFQESLTSRLDVLRRGHVEAVVECSSSFRRVVVDQELLSSCLQTVKRFSKKEIDPASFFSLPGVLIFKEDVPVSIQKDIIKHFDLAVSKLQLSRKKEGQKLEKLFLMYLKRISSSVMAIEKRRKTVAQEKQKELQALVTQNPVDFSQGIAEWLDRWSVDEELERLKMHVQEMLDLLKKKESGKEIEFYAQEMLREANTITSKSRDFHLKKHAIAIKSTVESIKEQVRNLC
jgi:uncharacterized protein (TIGR00255 family)